MIRRLQVWYNYLRDLRKQKTYWRLNRNIHAPKVRVIDEKGKQLGVLTLNEAIKKAEEAKLDLIEIAPLAKPPVAKIIDFGKFKYSEEKKQQKQKKSTKSTELKEVRLSPFIAEGDLETRLRRMKKFLKNGDKVKAVVKFKGRQMGSKPEGYKLLQNILRELGEDINIDMEPKFVGRHLTMVVSPMSKKSGTKKPEEKKHAKTENKEVNHKKV